MSSYLSYEAGGTHLKQDISYSYFVMTTYKKNKND